MPTAVAYHDIQTTSNNVAKHGDEERLNYGSATPVSVRANG
eukprot:SAG31_NODE_22180_length_532_cov_0.713626_2_plen_40_part_01